MDKTGTQPPKQLHKLTTKFAFSGGMLVPLAAVLFMPSLFMLNHWWYISVYIITVLMGVSALVGAALSSKRFRTARALILISAVGTVPAIWVDPFTWGVLLLPACILLLFAASGLREKSLRLS